MYERNERKKSEMNIRPENIEQKSIFTFFTFDFNFFYVLLKKGVEGMQSYSKMTTQEMEEYKKKYGFFYSATLVWLTPEGYNCYDDHDCTTRTELNEIIRNAKKEKNVVSVRRYIRHLGGKYKRPEQDEFIKNAEI